MKQLLGHRIQDRMRGWSGLRWDMASSPWSLKHECARAADRIDELEAEVERLQAIIIEAGRVCGQHHMNCPGASKVRSLIESVEL